MTLAQLRAFIAVLEHGTFTAAAHADGVSQASVSELISRLEEELGLALFNRITRGLNPTPAAKVLEPFARSMLETHQDALTAVGALKDLEGGSASIGVPRNARYYGLHSLAFELHQAHPGIDLRLVGINSALVAKDVQKGALEVGLVVLPVDTEGLDVEILAEHEVLVVSHQPLGPGPVPLERLAEWPLVLYDAHAGWEDPTRRQLRMAAETLGVNLNPKLEVEQVETALELVSAGAGVTIINDTLRRAGVLPDNVHVASFDPPMTESLVLVRRAGRILSPPVQALVRTIRARVAGA